MTNRERCFAVAVVSPFASGAIRGYLHGRSTMDGRRVEVSCFDELPSALDAGPWDAIVAYEGVITDGLELEVNKLVILPSGHDATKDAVFGGEPGERERIIARTENRVRRRLSTATDVVALQGLEGLDRVFTIDPHSQSASVRRAATVIFVVAVVLGVALVITALVYLAKLQ